MKTRKNRKKWNISNKQPPCPTQFSSVSWETPNKNQKYSLQLNSSEFVVLVNLPAHSGPLTRNTCPEPRTAAAPNVIAWRTRWKGEAKGATLAQTPLTHAVHLPAQPVWLWLLVCNFKQAKTAGKFPLLLLLLRRLDGRGLRIYLIASNDPDRSLFRNYSLT